MNTPVMLKCGCVAVGVRTMTSGVAHDPLPWCMVHNCVEIAPVNPDLTGRTARCAYGDSEVPSSLTLAFFEYCPEQQRDRYYCGCYGWE